MTTSIDHDESKSNRSRDVIQRDIKQRHVAHLSSASGGAAMRGVCSGAAAAAPARPGAGALTSSSNWISRSLGADVMTGTAGLTSASPLVSMTSSGTSSSNGRFSLCVGSVRHKRDSVRLQSQW